MTSNNWHFWHPLQISYWMKNAVMDLLKKKGDVLSMLKGSPSYNSFSYAQNTNNKVTISRRLETMSINEASLTRVRITNNSYWHRFFCKFKLQIKIINGALLCGEFTLALMMHFVDSKQELLTIECRLNQQISQRDAWIHTFNHHIGDKS